MLKVHTKHSYKQKEVDEIYQLEPFFQWHINEKFLHTVVNYSTEITIKHYLTKIFRDIGLNCYCQTGFNYPFELKLKTYCDIAAIDIDIFIDE